jgi:hypothetical protein
LDDGIEESLNTVIMRRLTSSPIQEDKEEKEENISFPLAVQRMFRNGFRR